MVTTDLKALEKLIKEILEKVKDIKPQETSSEYNETLEKINDKLETIDEKLNSEDSEESKTSELIDKVNEINTKLEEKSEDYIKEIQLAFENYQQKSESFTSSDESSDGNIKDFVSIITNEMLELKDQFDKFNTDFTEININTSMTVSKEILSMKNYVLALSDAVESIKEKVENFNPEINDLKENFNSTLEETTKSHFDEFKNDVYSVLAKISEGITTASEKIEKLTAHFKTFEGIELSVGEIIQNQQKNKADLSLIIDEIAKNQQKNKAEIIQLIKNNISEENKKLLPQIMQLVSSISFDESAEELKDGLFSVNQNLAVVNQHTEANSKTTEQISVQVEDLDYKVKNEISNKITKIDTVLDTISTEFNILTKGSKEDTGTYLYTLFDLESDISKVRVILDDLYNSLNNDRSLAESVTKNISDKLSNLNSFVEKTSELYASPDYKALLNQIDSLNDDITSISKRTNKLILTSDDSAVKLSKNIEDFQEILGKITASVYSFENSKTLKNLNLRTENIQKLLVNAAQSDKAISEAFIYLASWIDSTSEDIKKIKDEVEWLSNNNYNQEFNEVKTLVRGISDEINSAKDDVKFDVNAAATAILTQPQSNNAIDLTPIENIIRNIDKKIENNSKRIEILEENLSKITDNSNIKPMLELIISQIQSANENIVANKNLNKKLDKMDKQIQKLLTFVEEDE